jgi:hypothetical protein
MKRDRVALVALFLVALALRWPFRATMLEEFDSANYAGAVERIDAARHFPHPPGYIFLIWSARLLAFALSDPVVALSTLSALSGAASVALLYALARLVLGPWPSVAAALAYLFCAQAWFQHVRPMSDAFGTLWELAVVYALARYGSSDGARGLFPYFLYGAAGGAKQLLWLFLSGIGGHALLARGRAAGPWAAVSAVGAFTAGALLWLVPMFVLLGSPRAYVEWVQGEVQSQQPRETIFVATEAALRHQAFVTFDLVWLRDGWPWFLWPLAILGGLAAAKRSDARWLLSATLPIVAVRFAFLGYWPRFSAYYAPLVLLLAVFGFMSLHERLGPRRCYATLAGIAALVTWALTQTRLLHPTLTAYGRAFSPVDAAFARARERFGAEPALVVSDHPVLGRQSLYYAPRHGLRYVAEADLRPEDFRDARHVLKLQTDPIPRASSYWSEHPIPLGAWSVDVPHWKKLSPAEVWHASLFELPGAYTTFTGWRDEETPRRGILRWARKSGSTVEVVRAPAEGFVLRLRLAGPQTPPPDRSALLIVNGERRVEWRGGAELALTVGPEEVRPTVVIEVAPLCRETRTCLPVRSYEVVPAGAS